MTVLWRANHLSISCSRPGQLSVLPCTTCGNRKVGNCGFSFKCCMLLPQTRRTLKYHLVTAKPAFTVKTINCVHQTGPRKGAQHTFLSARLTFTKSVTVSFAVSKMGVVLIMHRSDSQWTILLEYVTISTNVRCYYRVVYNNFAFQQDRAPVHSTRFSKLLQCKTVNFLSPGL